MELVQTIKKEQEFKLLGSVRRRVDGGKIYEYDRGTGKLVEASFRTATAYTVEHPPLINWTPAKL